MKFLCCFFGLLFSLLLFAGCSEKENGGGGSRKRKDVRVVRDTTYTLGGYYVRVQQDVSTIITVERSGVVFTVSIGFVAQPNLIH